MKKTSNKLIVIIAAVTAVICGIIRFFQITSLTDLNTGWFLKGSEFGGILIYIALALSAAIFIVLAVVGAKKGDAAYSLSSDGMGSNATRFLGIAEFVGGLMIASEILGGNNKPIQIAAIIVSALCLLISGFILLGRIVPPAVTGHLMLVCSLAFFLRTASFFNSDLTVLNHAENLIVLLSYTAATFFFASSARFYSRLETKSSRMREILAAGIAFLPSAAHTISDLLAMLFGSEGAKQFAVLNMDAAAAALISGTFLFVLFFTKKEKDIIPLADEEENSKKKKE